MSDMGYTLLRCAGIKHDIGQAIVMNENKISPRIPFDLKERERQIRFFDTHFPERRSYKGAGYRLDPDQKLLNLAPQIREDLLEYFGNRITWHTHANHALSSQVCCLNFLAPLAFEPKCLSTVIGQALKISPPQMLPMEVGPRDRDWFVAFEWNGNGKDFLNESRDGLPLKRGSNSTSADAVVKFVHQGITELVLIEWKYTEKYGAPISRRGNETRIKRYSELIFAPNGPIKANLGLKLTDFFYEPFYQLLRQQMLAFQLQKARYDGVDRVRVLHLSPSGNHALHKVTSPTLSEMRRGEDAFDVFRSLLVRPEDFIDRRTEDVFGPVFESLKADNHWASYLKGRYLFLSDISTGG